LNAVDLLTEKISFKTTVGRSGYFLKQGIFIYKYDSCADGCHGRDRMVVGFATNNAISAYHH
jgi:hypothetical protein